MTQAAQQTLSGETGPARPEFDSPPTEPIALLQAWVREAQERGVREPSAVTLATADATGRASSRTLLIKEVTGEGLVFASSAGSRKGQDLQANPWASVTYYWRETLQQVVVAGPVTPLPAEQSDALFAERPRAARATTAASRQSRVLEDEQVLRRRSDELSAGTDPIDRPGDWSGYLLVPRVVEFWHGSPDRLHRRLRYERADDGWTASRLYP